MIDELKPKEGISAGEVTREIAFDARCADALDREEPVEVVIQQWNPPSRLGQLIKEQWHAIDRQLGRLNAKQVQDQAIIRTLELILNEHVALMLDQYKEDTRLQELLEVSHDHEMHTSVCSER